MPRYSVRPETHQLRSELMQIMHDRLGERLTSFKVYEVGAVHFAWGASVSPSKVNSNLEALKKMGYLLDAGPRSGNGGHQWYIPTVQVPVRMDRYVLEEWLDDNPDAATRVPLRGLE